ncbi:MAG TPA: peptidoglycan editing factor PgeF [Pyrinomonadaceae bacterium]|nr:peptidoglycan editing factor PgeF [Pyrinomonadaceae bacterium]
MPVETITEDQETAASAGFRWLARGPVRALSCDALSRAGFANAFSTRAGGCSPFPENDLNLAGFAEDSAANISENRRRFLSLFDGRWSLATGWQEHGTGVCSVREGDPVPDARDDERCDALTTNLPRVLLGVKTADCVPVLLGDTRTGACAAVHAGWRGTAAGIAAKALVRVGEEYGTRPRDVIAAVGPAALGCCYEVGPEVVEIFDSRFAEDAPAIFTPTSAGRALVDLHEANRRQLERAGVLRENIRAAPFCTMCRTDLFFSYRREKRKHGRTGRLLGVIGRDAEKR